MNIPTPKKTRRICPTFGHPLHLIAAACGLLLGCADTMAATYTIPATSYQGNRVVTNPDFLPLIQSTGNLAGRTGLKVTSSPPQPTDDPSVHGWFQYNFTIPAGGDGWYELLVNWNTAAGDNGGLTAGNFYGYTKYSLCSPGTAFFNAGTPSSAASGLSDGQIKPGNMWLTAGTNAIRVENYYYNGGMPPITSLTLNSIPANFSTNLRVAYGNGSLIGRRCVETGGSFNIVVQAGGNNISGTLDVEVWQENGTAPVSSTPVVIPAQAGLVSLYPAVPVPSVEGRYYLKYKVGANYVTTNVNLPKLPFVAISTAAVAAPAATTIIKNLLHEVDCYDTAPSYTGGNTDSTGSFVTRPVSSLTVGRYRESADNGYSDCNLTTRQPAAFGKQFIDWANWFAYTMPVTLTKGQLYLVEVDYPDDTARSMIMEVRQGGVQPYQVRASGVDAGGGSSYFTNTGAMKTHRIFFWANTPVNDASGNPGQPRVVILNYQIGMRAAAAKIRLYEVTDELPWLLGSGTGAGRHFAHWFEEAFAFTATYSDGSVRNPTTYVTAIERWAKMLKYVGGDTMWVTASVYGPEGILFPSNEYQKTFIQPSAEDFFKMALLIAKKYNLKVVAEFYPRASEELLTTHRSTNTSDPSNYPHLAMKKDGTISLTQNQALYNSIYPENQTWLKNMLKEFVLRYKSDQAFAGISLRSMDWQNTGLNNFHNLDWGYDAYTAAQFVASGISGAPTSDPGSGGNSPANATARYNAFTSTYAVAWDTFRASRINQLYTDLSAILIGDPAVKPVNPEFTIYSPVMLSGLTTPATPSNRPDYVSAGVIDTNNQITGFKYLHAVNYGRYHSIPTEWTSMRMALTEPAELTQLGSSRSFFATAAYAEDGGWTVPNSVLNLSAYTAPEFGAPSQKPYAAGHLVPAGRYNLERYALMMAQGDATMLVNGGNNYFIDQPNTREFLLEYHQLFPQSYEAVNSDLTTAVVVRKHLAGSAVNSFYAVNQTNQAQYVTLTFNAATDFKRATDSTKTYHTGAGNMSEIILEPFQLLAFTVTTSGVNITGASPGTALTSLVTSVNLATATKTNVIANTGIVGMKIHIPAPTTIRQLGRFVLPGNSGSHLLRLVSAAGAKPLVAGASVTINTSAGNPGEFLYGTLPAPVSLATGDYYLTSQEVGNEDYYYNHATVVSTTGMATVSGSVVATSYTDTASTWLPNNGTGQLVANTCQVPVSIRY